LTTLTGGGEDSVARKGGGKRGEGGTVILIKSYLLLLIQKTYFLSLETFWALINDVLMANKYTYVKLLVSAIQN
jgi:hypothetical protein